MSKCKRCHRELKTPECQAIGYGRVCFQKLFGYSIPKEKKQRIIAVPHTAEKEEQDEIPPLFDDIYFK